MILPMAVQQVEGRPPCAFREALQRYAYGVGACQRDVEEQASAALCSMHDRLALASEATLLFHGADWDEAKRLRWDEICESLLGDNLHDATTKVLCDLHRAARKETP